MLLSGLAVEVRAKDLTRLGQVLPEDLIELKASGAFNAVGSWSITIDPDHELAGALCTPGSGLVVTSAAGTLFSGPTTNPSYQADEETPVGELTVTGVMDDIVLNDRFCLTQPNTALVNGVNKFATTHDVNTGSVEDVMHAYVSDNAGPTATGRRREPRLVMGTSLHRGGTITRKARFDNLGALLYDLATPANLGYRVIQRNVGGVERLVFETFATTDRSDFTRLSIWNNTISRENVSITVPAATVVMIAGQGELEERTFYVGTDTLADQAGSDWGRYIERFVDMRKTDDLTQYAAKVKEILEKDGRTKVAVQVIPVDDDSTMTFGDDWNVGDIVGVDTAFGAYDALASGFVLKADSDGFQFGVLIGEDPTPTDVKRLNDLVARLSDLERSH